MAVFRVNKTRDYTVMSNYHLRDKSLSCKACGLLSKMLSLPENWDYTTRGLAQICKDGVDSIGSALKELEEHGYLIRNRIRDERGRMVDTEYIIYETPHLPLPDAACPDTENPDMETTTQLIMKEENMKKQKTDLSNTHSFLLSETRKTDRRKESVEKREKIRDQIEYKTLLTYFDRAQIDELVEIMLEVSMLRSQTIKIGRNVEYPTEYVQDRFQKIKCDHIQKVLSGIRENTTLVRNARAYLLASLFYSVSTMDNHYTMLVNHDLYGQ